MNQMQLPPLRNPIDNVLVFRLLLDTAPVVEIVPVDVKSKTLDMFLRNPCQEV